MMSIPQSNTTTTEPVNELPTYNAQELTKDGQQAKIILGDQIYSLRITRSGKLILTK